MADERYRLLVLGGKQVGKTTLVHKYLYNTAPLRYKETVEDLHSRDFNIAGKTLPLDMIECGSAYPDMRRLAIQQAHAVLLMFAVDDVMSFRFMVEIWQEISQQRKGDLDSIPIVVVANKSDIENHKITAPTVRKWMQTLDNSSCLRYVPTSATQSDNIVSVFRKLLELSQFNGITEPAPKASVIAEEQPDQLKPSSRIETYLARNRSFRVNKKERHSSGGGDAPSELKRSGSLLKRGISLRRKPKVEIPDESDWWRYNLTMTSVPSPVEVKRTMFVGHAFRFDQIRNRNGLLPEPQRNRSPLYLHPLLTFIK